jgi:hypothetical protein
MDKALKAKWVKALRSGRYKQAEGVLRLSATDPDTDKTTHKYCCLGVLAQIIDPKGWTNENTHKIGKIGEEGTSLRPFCGIRSEQQSTLINMNDTGDDFKTIADYIEKNVKED